MEVEDVKLEVKSHCQHQIQASLPFRWRSSRNSSRYWPQRKSRANQSQRPKTEKEAPDLSLTGLKGAFSYWTRKESVEQDGAFGSHLARGAEDTDTEFAPTKPCLVTILYGHPNESEDQSLDFPPSLVQIQKYKEVVWTNVIFRSATPSSTSAQDTFPEMFKSVPVIRAQSTEQSKGGFGSSTTLDSAKRGRSCSGTPPDGGHAKRQAPQGGSAFSECTSLSAESILRPDAAASAHVDIGPTQQSSFSPQAYDPGSAPSDAEPVFKFPDPSMSDSDVTGTGGQTSDEESAAESVSDVRQ